MKPKVMNRFFESIFLLLLIVLIYTLSIISADAQMKNDPFEEEQLALILLDHDKKDMKDSNKTMNHLLTEDYVIDRMNRFESADYEQSTVKIETYRLPQDHVTVCRFNDNHLHWSHSYLPPTVSFRIR